MEKNYFILVTNDSVNTANRMVSANDVAQRRLELKFWPFYKGTPNRAIIKEGDCCLIYIAGSKLNAQHIVGEAVVKAVRPYKVGQKIDADLITDLPDSLIEFSNVTSYATPVSVKANIDNLSLIPQNKTKWGAVFQSGCRKINVVDFKTLQFKEKI